MNYFNLTKEQEKIKRKEFYKTRVGKKCIYGWIVLFVFSMLMSLATSVLVQGDWNLKLSESFSDFVVCSMDFLWFSIIAIVGGIIHYFYCKRLFQDFVNQSK